MEEERRRLVEARAREEREAAARAQAAKLQRLKEEWRAAQALAPSGGGEKGDKKPRKRSKAQQEADAEAATGFLAADDEELQYQGAAWA